MTISCGVYKTYYGASHMYRDILDVARSRYRMLIELTVEYEPIMDV